MRALALCLGLLLGPTPLSQGMEAYQAGSRAHGALAIQAGLPIACLAGTSVEVGEAIGSLCRPQVAALTAAMSPSADRGALARIPDSYRPELVALARGAHVGEDALATANLVVDPGCSALADIGDGEHPTLIARNLDYAPVTLLGPGTLLEIVRRDGCHPFASVGWPGLCGVVSGINDAGLCAFVLLNLSHGEHRDGEPICFRLRRMLEVAGNLDEAARAFAASPVASSHYVFVADAAGATLLWQDRAGFHRQDAVQGWLACTNAPRDARGEPTDTRGRWLTALKGQAARDESWMRGVLGGCFLPDLNAQAMVLVPARLRLQLATGTGNKPAALCAWREVDLGPLMHGDPIAENAATVLPKVSPLKRYDERSGE